MKLKSFTVCALAVAVSACGNGETTNNPGSISLSGTPLEGQIITATVNDEDGVIAGTLRYQWRSGNSLIADATGSTLALSADQVGDPVSVVATYEDEAGFTEVVLSPQTADVERLIVNENGSVTISGDAIVGTEISSSIADGNGVGDNVSYQWMSGGQAIADATSATFEVTEAQIDAAITLMVTYTDNDGFDESLTSNALTGLPVPPENVAGSLVVTGDAIAGSTLTASVSDENGVAGTISYQWMVDGTAVDNATAATFVIPMSAVGNPVTVMVTYTDDDGFAESLTSSAVIALPPPPVNSEGSVAIAGDSVVGSTLTSTIVDANGVSGMVSYEWMANGVAIAGATTNAFVITSAQIDQAITLMVSYTDDDGFNETAASNAITATAPPAVNEEGTVVLSGNITVGSTLTAVVTDSNGISGTVAYAWQADGVAIAGASSMTFVIPDGLVGQAITATATYTDDDGFDESVTSPAIVAVEVPADNVAGVLTINGDAKVGSTLTTTLVDPNGVPSTVTYAWLADGTVIAGETTNSLVLTNALAGQAITATATYTDDDDFDEVVTATATAAVLANTVGTIALSGEAKVGEELSLTVDDDNGVSGDITYAWLGDNVAIAGASAATFTLTDAQAGQVITATASYTDDEGFEETLTSEATAVVVANTEGSVSISGSATSGQTLTAAVTDTNGVSGAVSYVWLADGVAIAGETNVTLVLTDAQIGQVITVTATYTDDDGFDESVTSAATAAVGSAATNSAASITLAGSTTIVAGTQVVSTLVDANGTTNATDYVWMADGVAISGASDSTYTPAADDLGKVLSVSISFTDDDGFSETVSATASGIVHTVITDSLADLVAATATVVDGDVIGINSGDYANSDADALANSMTFAANDLVIQPIVGSTAVISGPMCFELNGNNITVDGLSFADVNTLNGSNCASSGGSAITIRGDGIVFKNNLVDSEEAGRDMSAQFSWIALRGVGNTITRNSFTDSTGQKALTSGGVISVYSNTTDGSNQDHTISYNLFKDFPDQGTAGDRNGSAYMIQLGRSTGADSQGTLNTTVQFNLFKNVSLDRRYIKVQSSGNTIDSNTFLDGSGMIALEDGNNNTASNNIIINALSDNSDDGGISYGPFGHTITNNYIAGLRTTSGDRAGLYANSDVITNSGNASSTIALVTVANNSIFNSREAIEFASKDCSGTAQFIVDFDNNLVANDEDGDNLGLSSNGRSREAIQDDCALDPSSDFDNNHLYSRDITNSGGPFFTLFAGSSGNVEGDQGDADIAQATNLLWQGQNTEAGIGADVSLLTLLTEADVGPNSED